MRSDQSVDLCNRRQDNIRRPILPELRPVALHARGMYESQAASDSPYLASRAFRMLSEIAEAEGRYADAENESIRSVDLARQSRCTHASGEFNLAESLSALCQTLDSRGYFDKALQVGQEQQKMLEELCTKEPENLAHRRELGIACFWVGKMLANLSRWQESAEAFEQAIKATQAVIDAGGSFGSLNADLDAMTSWLKHVRDQINKK